MKILMISFFLLFVSSPSASETSTFAKQAQNISYLIEQLVTSNNKLWLNDNIFVDKYIIYNEHGEILIHDCDNSYNSRVKDIGKCLFYDKIHDEFLVNNAYLFNYKLDGIGTFPFAVKVDTSPDSSQNIDSALKLYFHETFHIYQKESFSQTYNTMYTFDNSFFHSATYIKLRISEVKLLLAFIKTGNIDHIKDFYNLRTELISSIKNSEFKQIAILETIEGTAKYIEVQAMESLAQLFGYSYLSNILEHEAAAFINPKQPCQSVTCLRANYYITGMLLAIAQDKLDINWQSKIANGAKLHHSLAQHINLNRAKSTPAAPLIDIRINDKGNTLNFKDSLIIKHSAVADFNFSTKNISTIYYKNSEYYLFKENTSFTLKNSQITIIIKSLSVAVNKKNPSHMFVFIDDKVQRNKIISTLINSHQYRSDNLVIKINSELFDVTNNVITI